MTHEINLWAERRLRQSADIVREELRGDLVRVGCVQGRSRAKGISAPFYFDKYLLETRPSILRRVARLMSSLVPSTTERLATRSPAALAVGVAVSLEIGLPLVVIEAASSLSDQARIEGEVYAGEIVTLIEEVVVTGSHALAGVERLSAAGGVVQHVVAMLDGESGAQERLREQEIDYRYIFGSSDLVIDEQAAGGSNDR